MYLPLEHRSQKDIGKRRRNIFKRQNSAPKFKSMSSFNPEMEVMDTVIGHSVVKANTAQRQGRQRILCLDGGGMKVKCFLCMCIIVIILLHQE